MRKFQDSIFSVIERNSYAICPPQKIALSKQIKKSLIACAVLLALSSESLLAANGQIINNKYMGTDPADDSFKKTFSQSEEFDAIDLPNVEPPVNNSQFLFTVNNGAVLSINGATHIKSYTYTYGENDDETAVHAFYAENKGTINLKGDIDIEMTMSNDVETDYGMSAVYAKGEGSIINLGSEGTTSRIWVLADKPDLISAKSGGQVIFESTRNKLVGSIDMMDQETLGTANSIVDLKISEDGNYWFGDEMSLHNSSIAFSSDSPIFENILSRLGLESDYFLGTEEINELLSNEKIAALIAKQDIDLNDVKINQEFKLTLSDGAQWTYFGFTKGETKDIEIEIIGTKINVSVYSVPKRISSITLSNGGIINLFDEDIRDKWEEIGLSKLWPELKDIEHDYVRIGKLKGNGGIFRLDLKSDEPSNSDEPSQSDMIFIESSEPGQHFIEPYRPEDLTSVSDTNRLTFALTAEGAKSVTFADKQNIYGNSLFDYELIIGYELIDKTNEELIDKIEKLVGNYETFDDFNIEDYYNGKHWFIKRLLTKESAASVGMRSAGYASYDLAVSMDRHDRRLQNAVFQNEEKDGLWARVQYGEAGAEHLYNADLTTVYVGYEKATSADNRLGFNFAYTDGDSDFNDLKGTGELKRYEASVYDTLTFGSHYLDFVARFGQVDNDFEVTNQSGALTTSGSFDQKYAALSAEYGYNFKDEHNVFIEPQVQLQVAYLGDYNYRTERNMKVDADSDISVIGRVGLRTGKTFESSDYVGELYARADVLHQFTDGQDAQFSDLSDKVNVTWGNKDTWSTFGVGGYLNWKDNVSFQVDVERTAGGETIDTWLVSGRFNYLF